MSNTYEYDYLLDASQLVCPMPLLKMRLQLQAMQPSEILLVITTDAGSRQDIPKYLAQSEHQLLQQQEEAQSYHFLIKKR